MDYVKIKNYSCKVTRGKVVGAWVGDTYRIPYTKSKNGGWDNASGDFTPTQLRGRIERGTVKFF